MQNLTRRYQGFKSVVNHRSCMHDQCILGVSWAFHPNRCVLLTAVIESSDLPSMAAAINFFETKNRFTIWSQHNGSDAHDTINSITRLSSGCSMQGILQDVIDALQRDAP